LPIKGLPGAGESKTDITVTSPTSQVPNVPQ